RLVKELRLRGVSGIEAGNVFLPEFMEDFNRRFARAPKNPHNAHRPLNPLDDLDEIFTVQEQRKVSANLTLHYKNVLYLLEPGSQTNGLRRNWCRVCEREDGTVVLKHEGRELPYQTLDKNPHVHQSEVNGALIFGPRADAPLPAQVKNALAKPGKPPTRAL